MQLNIHYFHRLLAVVLFALSVNTTALADDSAGLRSDEYLILGLGVGYVPKYLGDDEYEFIAQPSINAKYGDFFLNTRGFGMTYSGLGYNVVDNNGLKTGPLLNLDMGRDEDKSDDLDGLGDIDTTGLGGWFVEYEPGNWRVSAAALYAFAGDADGVGVNFTAGYDFFVTERFIINPIVSSTWVSEEYADTYFGIDSAQASASGLSQYEADGGFNFFMAGVNARYLIDEHWGILGIVSANKLNGSAADSPLTKTRGSDTSGHGSLNILYKF